MGVVIVQDKTQFLSRGYPYSQATMYVYCDHCGSFDIKIYWGARKWLLLVFLLVGFAALVALPAKRSGAVNVGWVLICLVLTVFLGLVLFSADAMHQSHRCRKCGHMTTTRYNTLDYSPRRMTIDVPAERVQERYLDYWPDMCDLDDWLKPPAQVAV